MKDHLLIMVGLGMATLIMAWLPSFSRKIKISYPIILLAIGAILFFLKIPLLWPDPLWPDKWLMYISEMIVIISLMGAGLKIGNNYSWKSWKIPFRLVMITMPLCMLAVYFLGVHLLSLSLPAAILLAATLAPTDPVLAAEVQIKEIEQKENSLATQFALTGEAGINDGVAFPFVFMAVLVAKAGSWENFDLFDWFLDKFLLKIILGIVVGYIIGHSIGYLLDRLYAIKGMQYPHDFVVISITLTTYGIAELLHGYGFLAVFVAALSIRYEEEKHRRIEEKMYHFVEETERFLLVIWIILFGGSILNGLLSFTDWRGVIFALSFIFLIRPVAGIIGMWDLKKPFSEKLATSFLGIRGIGSFFYLAWAFVETELFEEKVELYALTALVVLFSIIIHGISAPRIMVQLYKK